MQVPTSQTEFEDWFGASKAVDGVGQPMVLYHGTDTEFTRFSRQYIGQSQDGKLFAGHGFYFADTASDAKAFGARVMQVHLRMQNPLDLRDPQEFFKAFANLVPRGQEKTLERLDLEYREAKEALEIEDVLVIESRPGFYDVQWKIRGEWESSWPRTPSSLELSDDMTGRLYAERHALPPNPEQFMRPSAFSYSDITQAIQEGGYDSAINHGSIGLSGAEYIVFSADQIMVLPAGIKQQLSNVAALNGANKPLVVYHGTDAEFTDFVTESHSDADISRLGAYFTTDARVAGHYGAKVDAYHLAFNKLFDIAGLESLAAINKMPVSDRLKQELRSGFRNAGVNEQYGMLESLVGRGLRASLEAAGYDGVKYTEAYAESYIAFHPSQITKVPELQPLLVNSEMLARIQVLPSLKNKAGPAYTFYTIATQAIEQAGGDPMAIDWAQVEDETIRASICSNRQRPQQVYEALCQVSPGAINSVRQEAITVNAMTVFDQMTNGPGRVGIEREVAAP